MARAESAREWDSSVALDPNSASRCFGGGGGGGGGAGGGAVDASLMERRWDVCFGGEVMGVYATSIMSPRVWFITGASSGFGKSITQLVLDSGDIAVATLRSPDALADLARSHPADRLLVLPLDVTSPSDIATAFHRATDVFGRIDVVYNNAGQTFLAEFEASPDANARALFDVNFWGAVDVSRHALRVFREVNPPGAGGRLLQMSSRVGLCPNPMISFYSATKHALEAVSESMSMELNPDWNIKITIIEPGAFHTAGMAVALPTLPIHPAYATSPSSVAVLSRQYMPHMVFEGDADKANVVIYKIATHPDPPLRLPLGHDALNTTRAWLASVGEDVERAVPWSIDLRRDDLPPKSTS